LRRIACSAASEPSVSFSDEDLQHILFRYDGIFEHAAIRCNFTMYDVRRAQDSIKPRSSHNDIMLLAPQSSDNSIKHSFWYARVMRVFHANVLPFNIRGKAILPKETRMDFLWVHWFASDPQTGNQDGFLRKQLDRVTLLNKDDSHAFGFVDPAQIVRGCHMIPAFTQIPTEKVLNRAALLHSLEDDDISSFYVSRFVYFC
jgi:hypothetical protein